MRKSTIGRFRGGLAPRPPVVGDATAKAFEAALRDLLGLAEREFEQCLRVAPDYDQAYLNLAQLEVALGHKDRARALLQEFHKRHPENKSVEDALRQLGP